MSEFTRVLLVEDSAVDVELLRIRLEAASSAANRFGLCVAGSLHEANAMVAKDAPDVVLLDLGLPDSSGLETLRSFFVLHPSLPVIVLTALDDEETAVAAVNCGAQDFLFKDNLNERLLRRSIRYSMERHRLQQDQQRLHAELLNSVGDEQQRIALELHDEVGQGLAGLNMMCRSLTRNLRDKKHTELEKAELISQGIQDVLDSFRRVLCGLSPVDLDDHALPVALQRLCERITNATSVDCCLECASDLSIEDNVIATQLYRIAQESLTNAMRHAFATQLLVRLQRKGDCVRLQIVDNGVGFDAADDRKYGMGLRILRHRSQLVGGALKISSSAAGTTVTCRVQLHGSKDN